MVGIYLDEKLIRSQVIKRYLGNEKCFAFSCGNATYALKTVGANVIPISKMDALNATRYISPEEANRIFSCFNATPGCLPIFMISEIAEYIEDFLKYRQPEIFNNNLPIYVPTGSGETIFALSFVFPVSRLVAVVDTENEDTPNYFQKLYSPIYNFIVKNFKTASIDDVQLEQEGYFLSKGREHYKSNK